MVINAGSVGISSSQSDVNLGSLTVLVDAINYNTMTPGEEMAALAAAAKPVVPQGAPLALIYVAAFATLFSTIAVGMRIWARGWYDRRANNWGWDDTLSVLSLVGRRRPSISEHEFPMWKHCRD